MTVERFQGKIRSEDLLVVTGEAYVSNVRQQLEEMGVYGFHILAEPCAKNTAPAIILGMLYAKERMGCGDQEPIFVAPADHVITPKDRFIEQVEACERLALDDCLVTMGIIPTKPETGYGYIHCADLQKDGCAVKGFIEKPDLETAKKLMRESGMYWNSGMFCFTPHTMREEMKQHQPDLFGKFVHASVESLIQSFHLLPSISIDHAIAEKSQVVKMVPLDTYWNDIGSFDALFEYQLKDNNVQKGDVVLKDCHNSMFWSESRLIVGIGVQDTYIIETEDVILAVKKGNSQEVKRVMEELKEREEIKSRECVVKPWGSYTVLSEGEGFKVKKIVVKPGQRLSLQSHRHRNEHWVVVQGEATVQVGEEERVLRTNQNVYIGKEEKHRLSNYGTIELILIETQQGSYTGEDDIIRYEDIYDRTNQ